MPTPVLTALLVALMIVPLFLMLIVGYLSIEAKRRTRAAEEAVRARTEEGNLAEELVIREPRFFAKPGSVDPKVRVGRAVVVQIEDYLARERAAADEFVTSPSVETLCRASETFAMRKAAMK
jgi:hypothetical protein